MGRIAIVADSSACLPGDLIARYDIRLVPISLNVDGRIVPDGSIAPAEIFELAAGSHRIQTASPAPGDFVEAFQAARRDGAAEAVLCLTLSAAFSSTYHAALAAAELTDVPVTVVDTGGLAMTHGFAVMAAARALEAGATLEGAAAIARRTGSDGRLIGMLDTLRYLVKGGRIPWVVGWAASVLRIKPIIAFTDGRARSVARPRTWPAARQRLLSEVAGVGAAARVAVMHSAAPQRAAEVAGLVAQALDPAELLVAEFTSVMAVHTGPGFVGIAVCRDE
jgi:DegV family protein with EDD domain